MIIKLVAAHAIMMRTLLDMARTYGESSGMTSRRGQVAVEYVLLLMVGVSIAALIVSMVVSRNSDSPGFIIVKWMQFIQLIGADVIDR